MFRTPRRPSPAIALGVGLTAVASFSTVPVSFAAEPVGGEQVFYTEFSRTVRAADGSAETVIHAAPRYTFDQDGWRVLDSSVHASSSGAVAETTAGAVTFGTRDTSLLSVGVGEKTLHVAASGLNISQPAIAGSSVLYRSVAEDTDLVYTVLPNGVKEDLILKSASAPTSFQFRINDPDGVLGSVTEQADGSLRLAQGPRWDITLPAPTVFEASEIGTAGVTSGPADYTWSQDASGLDVTVSVDPQWLAQRSSFPVVLDPTIAFGTLNDHTLSKNGLFNAEPSSPLGSNKLYEPLDSLSLFSLEAPQPFAVNNGRLYGRSFLRFDTSWLPPDAVVESARLELWRESATKSTTTPDDYRVGVYKATRERWTHANVTSNEVAADFEATPAAAAAVSRHGQQQVLNVTSLTQSWVTDPTSNHGALLKMTAEDAFSYRDVEYVSPLNAEDSARAPVLRVTTDQLPLPPVDTDYPEAGVTNELTAVSMIAITAANAVLLPAQPVETMTEDQADTVAAAVDLTLDATPKEAVEAMVSVGGQALLALETGTLRPNNQALYDAVAPVVQRYAALKIPNPFTYGPEKARMAAGLSEEEFRVCVRHMYDCARNRTSADDSKKETKRRYTRNGLNDKSDAFRHCLWSALMTKRANAEFAERLGAAHEAANIRINNQPLRETQMDLHNNSRGRLAGVPDARDSILSRRCFDRQVTRDLTWLSG